MISFCDIPLIMSLEHRMKYGKYAIGLSKKSLISDYPEGLNPVNYIICTQQYKAALQLYTDYLECKSNWKAMIYDAQRQGAPTLNFKCDGFEYFGVGLNNKASQSNAWNLFNEIGNKHRYAISMTKKPFLVVNGVYKSTYKIVKGKRVLVKSVRIN